MVAEWETEMLIHILNWSHIIFIAKRENKLQRLAFIFCEKYTKFNMIRLEEKLRTMKVNIKPIRSKIVVD